MNCSLGEESLVFAATLLPDSDLTTCGWFAGYVAHRGVFPLVVGSSRRRQRWQAHGSMRITRVLAPGLLLQPSVSGSHLFDVLPEFKYADVSGRFRILRYLVRQWIQVYVSLRRCRWVTVSASQQRQVRKVQTVQLLAWTRMLTCPLLCSTDAWYRRAENSGVPQLQFVDQVETSLFGNRDRYAQCNCAVVSCQWVVSSGQLDKVVYVPVVQFVQVSQVPVVEESYGSHSCSSLRKSRLLHALGVQQQVLAENCGFPAVAVHQRSTTSLLWRSDCSSWSKLFRIL